MPPPFAVGRKNWLFCDTAKANAINPYNYLLYVLSVLPYYGKSLSNEPLEAQIPWSNEVQSRIRSTANIATE